MDERRDRLTIPPALREAMAAHARAAFPAECCGYLTGPRDAHGVDAIVACANLAREAERAYEIGGRELLALVRGLAGATPARAIYHSHTNGRAYFSARDAAIAASDGQPIYPVDHVVLGVTADGGVEAARFAWSMTARAYVEVERW